MSSGNKRGWKLQELVAHKSQVNCLALGHKSGRVMVTGGDDCDVNLWAIGKQSCFMNLSGHTSPVDCVQFNYTEEHVCSGSKLGALKLWDLEAAKLVRTLSGHQDSIRSIDFHPYGDYLISAGSDCVIKIWDSRKKGAIFTYSGHKERVNSVKFSPDGQWIASGSDDLSVKLWDMRIGKVLKQFDEHFNSVTCIKFHPHEFLLATGGADSTVNFFDLENFSLVSSEHDLGGLRALCFNPEGDCLFGGVKDYLKVIGWEPSRLYDSVCLNWGRICDISTVQNQLIGASYSLKNVSIYVADLKKIKPLSGSLTECPSPFSLNTSLRKSFSKAERPVGLKNRTNLDVKTIEESTSGTDPEEESSAAITNRTDYEEIFKGRALARTPPLEPEPFVDPEPESIETSTPKIFAEVINDTFEALSLDHNVNYHQSSPPTTLSPNSYIRSKSNLDQVYTTRSSKQDRENMLPTNKQTKVQPPPKFNLQRQSSCKDNYQEKVQKNNIRHSVSDVNLNKNMNSVRTRKNSFTKPNKNLSAPNVSKIPMTSRSYEKPIPMKGYQVNSIPIDICVNPVNSKLSPDDEPSTPDEEFIPCSIDRPVGLLMDDFLPKNHQLYGRQQQMPEMSEAEVLNVVMGGHDSMLAVLISRQRSLKIVFSQYRNKDTKAAFETAISLNDSAVIVDLLGVFNAKYSLWNLDLCVLILPKIEELIQSKYESYITTGSQSLKLILQHFGPVIKSNIQSPAGSFGVDIPREERYRKSVKCQEHLESIRMVLHKKQSAPGKVGNSFKELLVMMQNVLD